MSDAEYLVPQATDLLCLPGGAQAPLARRLLGLFLRNPFLDEDGFSLALRAGVQYERAAAALAALCEQGLLQPVDTGGYVLAVVGPEVLVDGRAGNVGCDLVAAMPVGAVEPGAASTPAAGAEAGSGGSAARLQLSAEQLARLQRDVVARLGAVERLLRHPSQGALQEARAALEQATKAVLECLEGFPAGSGAAAD